MELTFESVAEDQPGDRLALIFRRLWPYFRRWYLSEGEGPRPPYLACEKAIRVHMPEWLPIWERICALAGGGDLESRFLSLYRPPAYIAGCSQAVWTRGGTRLVRNYDYHPALCEKTILKSRWNGKAVIASTDCLVGALDGMNEDGLAVSLAFGGRRDTADGFAPSLLLRVMLETCSTVREARDLAARVPVYMAYNLLLLDRRGEYVTVYLEPGRPPRFLTIPASTNHQGRIVWTRHARATATVARETRLHRLLEDPEVDAESFQRAFLAAPLHNTDFVRGFGTLYTVSYDPERGEAEFLWPGVSRRFGMADFEEGEIRISVAGSDAAKRPSSLEKR